MSGILPGIPVINNFDQNEELMRGANLRVYLAGTLTKATAYSDAALTHALTWPVRADSAARLPFFWLPDGVYRVRLSSADSSGNDTGYVAYDIDNFNTVSPVVSGGGGGGGGGTAIGFVTGWPIWMPVSGTMDGWVRMNGRSIGSSGANGTERSNDDTLPLFSYLYTKLSDGACPVSGGRGASAAADFAANKVIQLPDMRFAVPIGLDNMGNSAAGLGTGVPIVQGSAQVEGSLIGEPRHTSTIDEMVNHNHGGETTPAISHTHSYEKYGAITPIHDGSGSSINAWNGTSNGDTAGSPGGAQIIPVQGGGQPHNNTPRSLTGTWYMKL